MNWICRTELCREEPFNCITHKSYASRIILIEIRVILKPVTVFTFTLFFYTFLPNETKSTETICTDHNRFDIKQETRKTFVACILTHSFVCRVCH